MASHIQRKEVIMKLPVHETLLDDLLETYVFEQADWPDSAEELDQLLLTCHDAGDEEESNNRANKVLSQFDDSKAVANPTQRSGAGLQRVFFETDLADGKTPIGKDRSQSLAALFGIV